LLDVKLYRVNEMDAVPEVGEPGSVGTRAPADIQDAGRTGREEASQQLFVRTNSIREAPAARRSFS
jgi:hypothetical protein